MDAEHLGGGRAIAAAMLEDRPQQGGLDDSEEPLVELRLGGLTGTGLGLLHRPTAQSAPGSLGPLAVQSPRPPVAGAGRCSTRIG